MNVRKKIEEIKEAIEELHEGIDETYDLPPFHLSHLRAAGMYWLGWAHHAEAAEQKEWERRQICNPTS